MSKRKKQRTPPCDVAITQADYALLTHLLAIQSHSRNDDAMIDAVTTIARTYGATIDQDRAGNLYATKGRAPIMPFYVAHTDTVHKITPTANYQLGRWSDGTIGAYDPATGKMTGSGGDDKCGITVALVMLRDLDDVGTAFMRDEEIGCIGAYGADLERFDRAAFIAEADRRGGFDLIRDAGMVELHGDEFAAALNAIATPIGYREAYGVMTDVMALKERGVPVAALNASAGYYDPHMSHTTVKPDDVARTIDLFRTMALTMGETRWNHTYTDPWRTTATPADDRDTCPVCRGVLTWSSWCADCQLWMDLDDESTCPACGEPTATDQDAESGLWYCYACSTWFDGETRETWSDEETSPAAAD